MRINFYRLLALGFLLQIARPALAQLEVVYPISRMVVQRNNNNKAQLTIAGTYSVPVDRIEVRLRSVSKKNPYQSDWMLLQANPQHGVFQGAITADGGWYILDVRGLREGRMVSMAQVDRVGVGEIFLISGQSNAMGVPNLGAKSASERVVSFDANNTFYNKNDVLEAPDGPFPVPVFTQLLDRSSVFPGGSTSWSWGELGDLIADRFDVPVAFFNASWPATVAENWSATAKGNSTMNIYVSKIWPYLQPYSNLRNSLLYLHSQFGIRTIIWHHGESDSNTLRTSTDEYRRLVQDLIDGSRRDFAKGLTWMISRNSVGHIFPDPVLSIVNAQNQLIQAPGNNVWPGPDTDGVQKPRPSHGHFENVKNGTQGLTQFARAWNEALTDDFFKKSQVILPAGFIRTGLIPAEVPAGAELVVPFTQTGLDNNADFAVHLVDSKGYFIQELGRSKSSPIRLRLPASLDAGTYRLRVVAAKPVLPGVPSTPFRIVASGKPFRTMLDAQVETVGVMTEISWLTAQEPLNGYFVVERLDSQGQYQPLGQVQTRADGALHHLYTFVDKEPLEGANKYRVRHELPSGTVQYSAEMISSPMGDVSEPFLFPNPTNGENLSIRFPESGSWEITLLDLTGKIRWQQSVLAIANRVVPLSLPTDLMDGAYLMQLHNETHRTTRKLIIHR